jgi:phosphoribosyl 1,2-cyclic phosphate phosphodiesterase
MSFKVTLLGTGTSTGVPIPGCICAVCTDPGPNERLRASAWIQIDGKSLLIDPSADFRQQALRAKIPRLDAVLVTHPHTDHISGFDDLRPFNFIQGEEIPLYGHRWSLDELKLRYHYAFGPPPTEGGGVPRINLHEILPDQDELTAAGVRIGVARLQHGSRETLGFRVEDFAYCTDFNHLEKVERDKLRGLSVLILDCVRHKPHSTHLHLRGALEIVEDLRPERTVLIHMGHELDARVESKHLPPRVEFGIDGLELTLR